MKNKTVESRIEEILTDRGFSVDNTIFADSTCPDEVNHTGSDISSQFQKRFGNVFPLAGLAGIPFAGKTGWQAFTSHVP